MGPRLSQNLFGFPIEKSQSLTVAEMLHFCSFGVGDQWSGLSCISWSRSCLSVCMTLESLLKYFIVSDGSKQLYKGLFPLDVFSVDVYS